MARATQGTHLFSAERGTGKATRARGRGRLSPGLALLRSSAVLPSATVVNKTSRVGGVPASRLMLPPG